MRRERGAHPGSASIEGSGDMPCNPFTLKMPLVIPLSAKRRLMKTAYSTDFGDGETAKVYHFDVVSFNGDLLFSACALQNTPAVRIVERPEMLKFPIASGQRYVLVHGTTIIPMRRDLGNYLIPESRNRITVVREEGGYDL